MSRYFPPYTTRRNWRRNIPQPDPTPPEIEIDLEDLEEEPPANVEEALSKLEPPKEEDPPQEDPPQEEDEPTWKKYWNKPELLQAALEAGLTVSEENTKAEIIEALESLDDE
jgi:hypothetical protein